MRLRSVLAIVVFAAVGYVEAPDAACATEPKQARETVLITYHVVPGKEKERNASYWHNRT
jgi:hypothetical protein